LNHTKINKSSTALVKKNPLQNTAKLAEERLKDKLAMAAKEKLVMLERERTKKEKEKIQAERKRKAAQFLASMKIVSSSSKNPNSITHRAQSETSIPNSSSNSPIQNTLVVTDDKKSFSNDKNGLPDNDVKVVTFPILSSKVQDVISIDSSDEDMSHDGLLKKNVNSNKNSKMSLQSRLQETLTRDEKRKREDNEKDKVYYKRTKHNENNKDKTPDHRYSSHDKNRSSRRSKKTHSSHHSSSKDRKRDRSSRRSKHKHKSKKSKKHTHNHNNSSHHSDSSDNSTNTNNSGYS